MRHFSQPDYSYARIEEPHTMASRSSRLTVSFIHWLRALHSATVSINWSLSDGQLAQACAAINPGGNAINPGGHGWWSAL